MKKLFYILAAIIIIGLLFVTRWHKEPVPQGELIYQAHAPIANDYCDTHECIIGK